MAVDAVLIGCGLRGRFVYGRYASRHPERLRIVALAEPDPERRAATAAEHGLAPDACFSDAKALLAGPVRAPVAIIATPDTLHVEPALQALERGYHLLLEKPIAPDPVDCLRVVRAAEARGRILQIGHVLRYTPFYNQVAEILRAGRVGRILQVEMREHVAAWHFTHSFVRGKFRNRAVAAPMIVAKCCHDLDLLCWFLDQPAVRVSALGGLAEFRPERAPAGAPARCSDGCPVQATCPHDAVRFYAAPDEKLASIWPWNDLCLDPAREARERALAEGPYGRCVYRCDNDVADHHTALIEFADGARAIFAVQGNAVHEGRTLRITGSEGELRGLLHEGVLELARHDRAGTERFETAASPFDHYGGDVGLLDHFSEVAARGAVDQVRASGRVSLASHLLGFAAEEARHSGRSVDLAAYAAELERAAGGVTA